MNAIQAFDFEGKNVRVVNKDGEPWWVAKDVCSILEIEKYRDAISRLDDDERESAKLDTLGGIQDMSVISESGLYSLIFRSNKPEARKFRKWVTSEVIPNIRKTGAYSINGRDKAKSKIEQAVASNKRAEAMLNNSRVRLAKCAREIVKDIWDILSPESKQTYSAYVIETVTGQPGLIPLPVIEQTYSATELGTEFGVSANRIGRLANELGIKTPEFGIEILDKAKGHEKQVPNFRYNERGRDLLRKAIIVQA